MQQLSVLTDFETLIKEVEAQNKDNKTFIDLSKANDFYNELIANGTIKKRGYTLRCIDDYHLLNVNYNR